MEGKTFGMGEKCFVCLIKTLQTNDSLPMKEKKTLHLEIPSLHCPSSSSSSSSFSAAICSSCILPPGGTPRMDK